jgi:hypothetical protein
MSIVYDCPVGSEIADLFIDSCPEQVGQIQKIIVQRLRDGGSRNEITIASTNPNLKATWTALFAASDNTKCQITPFVESPNLSPGDPETVGGGNDSLNGVPQIIADGPTTFEGFFYQTSQRSIKSLKELRSEEIQVFFVNEHQKIIGEVDDHASPTVFRGFQLNPKSWSVGDKSFGGFNDRDANRLQFAMVANWSDYLHIVTPVDFNPLVDLTN